MFCALDLPAATIASIEAWQKRAVGGDPRWRAVAAGALHVTLAFLGDRPPAVAGRISEILAGLDVERPVEGLIEPDPAPLPRRAPRLLALSVAGEAIPALQAPLAAELTRAGLYEPERRPFWAHVTVLRRRGRGTTGGLVPPFHAVSADGGSGHAFGAVRIALYRSEIRPDGSKYTCLAARDLPPASGRQKR